MQVNSDSLYINRCVELAMKANKNTKTNPMVGAVLVYENRIIGEGYHEYYGGPHAEVNAFLQVSQEDQPLIKDATLYVSLEPCNIFGKTPPCTQKILESGIKKVVIGTVDPNPKMDGSSIDLLKNNGIDVKICDPENSCKYLIRQFEVNLKKEPYFLLKWAQSMDNVIGLKTRSLPISSAVTNVYTHKLRSEYDGILIGKNTALTDNPRLTTRHHQGENPTRILLDSNLEIPLSSDIFLEDATTLILNSKMNKTNGHLQYINLDTRSIEEVKHCLFENKIFNCIVEGGPSIHDFFIKNNAWHEALIIKSDKKIADIYDQKDLVYAKNLEGQLTYKIKIKNDTIYRIKSEH
jgi:diaminohydroxyphosphoribosylaminopyrimidine deaminase / 5-amino-6-(5-phosphoribosylamino)uracil reductase